MNYVQLHSPQYSTPVPVRVPVAWYHNETNIWDSDSDSNNTPSEVYSVNDEVIVISSSPETPESDSETDNHQKINLNLSFRDQPSTSTGIRNIPNNR